MLVLCVWQDASAAGTVVDMEIPRYEEELPEIDQEDRSVFLDEQLDQRIFLTYK